MNNYVCKYGLYHHKECKDGGPSSNNGWIYTAYAVGLGLKIDPALVNETYKQCMTGDGPIRLPEMLEPPISRDEIIGMLSLRLLHPKTLERYGWYFHGTKPKYSLFMQLKAFWYLNKKHRNTLWKEKVFACYPIAFTLWHHDRYYAKKINGMPTTLLEKIAFYAYVLGVLSNADAGEENLLWLQLKDIKVAKKRKGYPQLAYTIKEADRTKNFLEVFGPEHIFNE